MPIIEVEHLHKRYRDTVAVEDVSPTVEAGEIFTPERLTARVAADQRRDRLTLDDAFLALAGRPTF